MAFKPRRFFSLEGAGIATIIVSVALVAYSVFFLLMDALGTVR
jgi:hypothetical protein